MLRSLLTIGLALALFSPAAKAQTDCDQHSPLCARRFHEVTYATTHNAFNHRGWFLFPNQDGSITEQLDEGVRGLMLDVHYLVSGQRSVPLVYHSFASLGFQPLTKVLGEVKRFLDREPGEVVTLILENYVDNEDIDNALLSSGLKPRLYTHDKAAGWPTLHDMIARDQRLVILNSKRERRYAWSTYVWDVAVETSWSNHALADFTSSFRRGNASNDLFILNHFLTDSVVSAGSTRLARQANSNPFFLERVRSAWRDTGKRPNFVTVDFYRIGDVLEVVDHLNGFR